ncbi:Histone-like DNA-binding superfamily protein HimA/HU/Integration host factor (himA/hup_1) [Mycoplasma suis KI3806]|uniref:Histone-like DNA-binding superfamily protein HimA/HU/Integration host factor (HimA/hup_1) n=1 Tax=Mycoplasma suis (strain KI_3806) TaxID=708248 RepID=F0V1J0_MYCS3|nr:HU family DNA-binding protein [Mycoplasma suis]CBZ40521.1 Histone-like DNA-binding superfamily protein HimA/HU/Integration host factor (himA/hup_1) [Mycoplasma suis KI3806]
MLKKDELIKHLADKCGCTQNNVASVLREYQYLILENLKKEGKVNVLEFGSFEVVKRSARTGVNPQTKAKIDIPEKEVPRLKASKKFKEFVSGQVKDIFTFNF